MKKQLEKYFGCKVKIAEYKNKLPLPIFMTMRDIMMVEIYGVNFAVIDVMKETELSVAAMKKQKAKYEEVLQCPVAYEVALNSVSMRNALVKSGVPFVDLPGNVFLPFMGIVLQDVYRKQPVKTDKMMPATQMVFLELLYMEDEETVLKSEVANKLNLTKTSITRATAQLEEMGLIRQVKSGTEIAIMRNYSRKEYYENAKAYLINPVQKEITIIRIDSVYGNFVKQIAGDKLQVVEAGESLKDTVAREEEKESLRKQIANLQTKMKKEKQLNKQMELNAQIKNLKKGLEVL